MPTPAAAGDSEYRISMPAARGDLTDGELEGRKSAATAMPEECLNRFVRFVALGEWTGNAFGALAFLWATGVLLGGFCASLNHEDFWFATVMIFIEAIRIFSRNYRSDNRSLFGTTRALKWISSSFSRMLGRPQEGGEVVLIVGLWIFLIDQLPIGDIAEFSELALLILMSRRPRRPGQLQIWAVLISFLGIIAYELGCNVVRVQPERDFSTGMLRWLVDSLADAVGAVSVLLLGLRPRRIVILTNTPCGRKLLSLAKVISAVWLTSGLVLNMSPSLSMPEHINYVTGASFTTVVLSLGSLQSPATCDIFGPWIDVIIRICFLWDLVFPFPDYFFYFLGPNPSPHATAGLSFIILLVLLLTGNLQIPAAAVQVVLSSSRFHRLLAYHDYSPLPEGSSPNMVPAIEVFYVLAFCQGSLYIMASILGVFSFFPRRSLARQSKLCGQSGAKAIDLYYQRAYAKCMDTGLLAAWKTLKLSTFAMESLRSRGKVQLAGVLLIDNILSQETDSSKELKSRIISSNKVVSMLIGMLGWSDARDRDIRLFAARAVAKLADSIRIAGIPCTVKLVSSLLDDGNQSQPARQQASLLNLEQLTSDSAAAASLIINGGSVVANNQPQGQEPAALITSGTGGGCSWARVRQYWQRMKQRWSIPEDPPLTHQGSLPMLGILIFEKLAYDLDNCAEMLKASYFISKIMELISYSAHKERNNYDHALICSLLHLVTSLAGTSGKIGATVRRKLWESPFLLDNLVGIFEDSRSSPEVWTLAMDIIAKLALDEDARQQIGSNRFMIGKLVRAFLGQDARKDQSLRMAAGEALVYLTMENTSGCSAILEEPGYELMKDLKDMLYGDECRIYIYMAASLLQNLCEHSRDKLMNHPGVREHLRSVLQAVMENIVSAEGKQLEILIGLASQICSIPECFAFELEAQTNEVISGLVKKLVGTLVSNRKPSLEYPRMRKVIVEMIISVAISYPGYRAMLKDEGVMEALSKAARTPSQVEKYRVFSGDEGVVVETGLPLCDLVGRAKGLIGTAIPTTPDAQDGSHA